MTSRTYIAAMSSIFMSIVFTPWIDEALKFIAIAMFIVITLTVNIAFRVPKIWNAIVDRVAMDVLHRVLLDRDIRKVVKWMHEKNKEEIRKKKEEVKEKRE